MLVLPTPITGQTRKHKSLSSMPLFTSFAPPYINNICSMHSFPYILNMYHFSAQIVLLNYCSQLMIDKIRSFIRLCLLNHTKNFTTLPLILREWRHILVNGIHFSKITHINSLLFNFT